MELKDYQRRVMEKFAEYLAVLRAEKDKSEKAIMALNQAGVEIPQGLDDFPRNAWNVLKTKGVLPRLKSDVGVINPDHVQRYDSRKCSIPHICLKVPTGGGKTLLASDCIGHLQIDLLSRQTGLVLWVVPTVQIYRQTWNALADKLHPYRQMLERATGGRVKVLEKDDPITHADTKHYLCIMLVRLAATNRTSNKEFLKIFRDAGKYTSFFPEIDDATANKALLNQHPDLETYDMAENAAFAGVLVKQSLVNVFKMQRPIVVIDEGHKAYSENTRDSLNAFNPSFILELTATPNQKHQISNVLVDVSGLDLKDEQMIKLPINIKNTNRVDWHITLTEAYAKRAELEELAQKMQASEGRYIRPILVVRVERTGKDQRDGKKIHADDAKEFLIQKLAVDEKEIRIKSSEKDELGNDDLLAPLSPVRFIITKEALQEGWDCPFAYVLALLDKTTASTALTQMIGRILRQPEARATKCSPLNECYVFCHDQDVNDAVQHVRKGLEDEGMDGLSRFVRATGAEFLEEAESAEEIIVKRRSRFKELQIFLPRVLHADGKNWREICYDRDILSHINWESLQYDAESFLSSGNLPSTTLTRVDVTKKTDLFDEQPQLDLKFEVQKTDDVWIDKKIEISFLARQLMDIIPNPWQASRIVMETIEVLRLKKDDTTIYNNRLLLIEDMKKALKKIVDEKSEKIFRKKLLDGQITFQLVTSGNKNLNYEIAKELKKLVIKNEKKLHRTDGDPVENSLFELVFEKEFNALEKNLAICLSEDQAIFWWHRMVARHDYSLQGWQRNKIYPDFIACLKGDRVLVLETKGLQLKGNDDTDYKQKLMSLLTEYSKSHNVAGEVSLTKDKKQSIRFAMLMEDSWRQDYEDSKRTPP